MKRKIKFLIFILLGFFSLVGILDFLASRKSPDKSTASLKEAVISQDMPTSQGPVYSFYQDSDLDGLSNAKEIIYGSNVFVADTDGDGKLDGEEVCEGLDPIIAGSAKLEDKKNLNTTIRYFLWTQKEKGTVDPKIEKEWLNEFLAKEGIDKIYKVNNEEIIISQDQGREAVREYLNQANKISLPEGVSSYGTLAQNYTKESEPLLEDLLSQIELGLLDFKKIKTPKEALEIQRNYLTIMKEFASAFQDLKYNQADPIKIEANLKKAKILIDLALEAENLKLELIKKYDIS